MKRRVALILLYMSGMGTALSAPQPFTVVIDPGHGGNDHGATFGKGRRKMQEKEITLAIAKEVAQKLRQRKIRAVLTRSSDKNVALAERTAIANRIGADVFLSIHMNSAGKFGAKAEGIETFILNSSTDATSKRLADLENSVLDGSAADQLNLSDVNLILKDLMLDANREESTRLACQIQNSLTSNGQKNRGVKQALFYVLLGADMPSVLVETGFIDNPRDRYLATTQAGRVQIAKSIARAVDQFRQKRKAQKGLTSLSNCKIN